MLARMARGIAHDLNNALSVILSYADFISEDMQAGEPAMADIDEIRAAGMRAADLSRQLSSACRPPADQPRAVDLGKIVAGTEKLLRRMLGTDIELGRVSSNRCWPVSGDPGQLEHVIMHAAMTARYALPSGGWFTIETKNVELATGPHVLLAFSASGSVVDNELQLELLAPVLEIARHNGGQVASSATPTSTRIEIQFARSIERGVAIHGPTIPPVVHATPATETVLLVVEDSHVATVAAGILRREGYQVLLALNAGDALITCEQHAGTIDLLLTEVALPRMSGRQLAERLRTLRSELVVAYLDGAPITPALLSSKVRSSLDARRSPVL